MRTIPMLTVAAALLCAAPRTSHAAPILGGPGSPDNDPVVDSLAKGYQRQQDVFATLENGLSLDPFFDPAEVQTAKDFFAQTATDDFQQFSGKHPYEVLTHYDEHGDEGNFAGIASVGVAARLLTLKAAGAPEAELAPARDAAVRAARAWHVYATIGGTGVVARGIRRVEPWSAGDPPFPGEIPELIPLTDGSGNPLPAEKKATWRAPVVPGYEGWIWFDDTSKDQVSGYALAAAWLWDALHDDPAVPADVADNLASGLVDFARALMKTAPEVELDLCIRDADGRLTRFYDLNSRLLSPGGGALPEDGTLRNGFNAAMALAILRAAYHVSGDEEIGRYYYEQLVGARDYPSQAASSSGIIFLGAATNYSNVNMLTISLAAIGRFETDPYVRGKLEETLESQYWSTGSDRDVSHVRQAWFDSVYAAYSASPPAEIRDRVRENLGGFQPAPAFQREIINCDDVELAASSCIAIDGVTKLEILPKPGHNGQPVAKEILPMSIRPDSDFAWRSDPHTVNGKGSPRMNPGGDFLAAYWLARLTDLDDTKKNISPFARPPLSYTLGGAGGSGGAGGVGNGGDPDGGGCACELPSRTSDSGSLHALGALAAAALGVSIRRARRAGGAPRRRL